MADLSPDLIAAYKATRFCAKTPDLLEIRIGTRCPGLEALLSRAGRQDWAFITAFNPASESLAVEENQARHRSLLQALKPYRPHIYEGAGQPIDETWDPEISVLILGIARDEAIEVGGAYGQHAIVVGRKGNSAELVLCDS